jgi:hypothetical protein
MSAASKVVDFSQAAATSGCWSRKLVNSSEGCLIGKVPIAGLDALGLGQHEELPGARAPISSKELGRPALKRGLHRGLFGEVPLVLCGIDVRPELDFMQTEYLGHGNPLPGRNHSCQSYCMPTYRHKTEASETRGKTFR